MSNTSAKNVGFGLPISLRLVDILFIIYVLSTLREILLKNYMDPLARFGHPNAETHLRLIDLAFALPDRVCNLLKIAPDHHSRVCGNIHIPVAF